MSDCLKEGRDKSSEINALATLVCTSKIDHFPSNLERVVFQELTFVAIFPRLDL